MLSAMHTAYLTACARKGISLAIWEIGITVLLEKIIGNNLYTNFKQYASWKLILTE
jgi:hypothetical protein